ncbi:membrane hypothetical protein [Thiomonas sp. X19]|uniref:DUF4352 domain-containing protein n=1 Tax=Thiomonas sp. X19 TaxID=1050370 RepID=UPI000B746411|nr:DUF4352 domain-containing protein [Thiomonas sp. X19]SCC93604.1 membrane hypothetical protein [Thiomonas sp. X19]SCC94717.1 membrane hypothetical protein [Thiomonas sp. X19]
MKKAGGILGIIGGVFGVFAALVTLFIGGVGGAFQASGAGTIIGLGWGGLAFSFLSIIFGAVSLGARSRTVGVLLTLSALGGAILGGTMVAICMVLALVGGVLATLGTKPEPAGTTLAPSAIPTRRRGKLGKVLGAVAAVVAVAIVALMAIGIESKRGGGGHGSLTPASAPARSPVPAQSTSSPAAAASSPQAFQVGETFATQTFHVTITSASVVHSVGDLLTSKAPAGAEYVAVAWRYTNRSQAPVSAFAVPSVHLLDAQGHRYDADLEASSFYAAQIHASAKALSDVNPGITLTDGDVFEVSSTQFNPATWTIQVRVDGQDVIVRFPALSSTQASAPVKPSVQAVARASIQPAVSSAPMGAASTASEPALPAAPVASASQTTASPTAPASVSAQSQP